MRDRWFWITATIYIGGCFLTSCAINASAQQTPDKRECQTLEACYDVIAELRDQLAVSNQMVVQLDNELRSAHGQLTGLIQQRARTVISPEQERLQKREAERKKAAASKKTSGNAVTYGDNSPANTGDVNQITVDKSSEKKK